MIVSDIMTTQLVTVAPDDTLARAAALFRQHQFHHLPVTRSLPLPADMQGAQSILRTSSKTVLQLEGLLTAQDVDMAAALDKPGSGPPVGQRPWQERLVFEVMHRADIRVTPNTSVAAATQILVERGLNYLPVVEYVQVNQENKTVLVGLLTRSDILLALSRAMGAFEPGMQLDVALPFGNMAPLTKTLQLATELHVSIRSVIAAPLKDGVPQVATLRLGTINPAPLLIRLQHEGIRYSFGAPLAEGEIDG